MNNLLRNTKVFWKRNGSTILTCAGAVGVVTTSVMAVKATPKALEKIDKAKEEKGEELTTMETVRVAAPSYIPTILIGASTIACIFGANVLNKRSQAALASAYALLDNSFKEYKEALKELYGEEAHQNIMDHIAIEKAKEVGVSGSYFATSCDLTADDSCGDPVLFYEEYSNRYFEATIEQVINAEYHLNRNYILRGYSYLNELYEFLGLELTEYGDVMGWTPTDEGEYWVEFNHRKVVLDDGLECYILEMPFEPKYDFLEYNYY
jgi:hypothetical protein